MEPEKLPFSISYLCNQKVWKKYFSVLTATEGTLNSKEFYGFKPKELFFHSFSVTLTESTEIVKLLYSFTPIGLERKELYSTVYDSKDFSIVLKVYREFLLEGKIR